LSVGERTLDAREKFTARTRCRPPEVGRMKLVIPVALIIVLLAVIAAGQQAQPGPTAAKTEEVPTPAGTPEPQGAPDLLPGSNQLPAEPPNLRLPSPSMLQPDGTDSALNPAAIKQLSPEEQEKNKARVAELKAIAMRNPRAIEILNEANGALSDEAKREFMRAYYHTLSNRMRNLEPDLSQAITAFERSEIRKLAAGPSRISLVSRDVLHKERQRRARPADR
jgi:hypothetical protein